MKAIILSDEQQLDLELAVATEDFEAIDSDIATYIAYQLCKGPIPAGSLLARTCSRRCCVNPSHLVLVDPGL